MREPTEAQAQLVRYFAVGTKPTMRTNKQTYARCEAEGWLARTVKFPYHEATDKGRKAIGMPKEEIDAEFDFIADYDGAGQPKISRLVAINGDVFAISQDEPFGMPKKHTVFNGLIRAEAVDIVNKFRATHLEAQHADALQMDRTMRQPDTEEPDMTKAITIPWDGRSRTFNRDLLETATLLWLDHDGDNRKVYRALVTEYEVSTSEASELTVAARICVERGIEP